MDNPTFEASYDELDRIVAARRGSWTYLSLMEWSDVRAILIEQLWRQWHYYDPAKGPLENWANTVISRRLINLRRDLLLRLSRPCIGGWNAKGKACVHNLGGDACAITKTHKQCAECPIYADWQKAREHQLNLKSTVSLENHAQEVSNRPSDYCDYDSLRAKLDQRMRSELTTWEWNIYVCVYVHHMTPAEASTALEARVKTWKRAPREDEQFSYQFILTKQRWFKELMIQICRDGHLDT